LFVDAVKLSVVQPAAFHLSIVLYFDETTFALIVFHNNNKKHIKTTTY